MLIQDRYNARAKSIFILLTDVGIGEAARVAAAGSDFRIIDDSVRYRFQFDICCIAFILEKIKPFRHRRRQ